jgi:cyclic beta-1,2-glucan synthetase
MYRAGLESILGLRRSGAAFAVNPCIPSTWPGYEIVWRFLSTTYTISVLNPDGRCRGVREVTLDGVVVDDLAIPLVDDGRAHDVVVRLGAS